MIVQNVKMAGIYSKWSVTLGRRILTKTNLVVHLCGQIMGLANGSGKQANPETLSVINGGLLRFSEDLTFFN